MQTIRSIVFVVGMLIGFLALFLALLIFRACKKPRIATQKIWGKTSIAWLKICCKLDYQIVGIENIMEDQKCVCVSNHQSAWETMALQTILPHPITWVAKRSLLFVPIMGWCYFLTGSIAISRNTNGREAITHLKKLGKKRLLAGDNIMIFPEGTRFPHGEVGEFKRGGSILAKHAGVPILPIAHNAGKFWPRRTIVKYAGIVTIKIGKPINVDGKSNKQINDEVSKWIHQTIAEIG